MGLPTLFLIRHGETRWSLSGQHTGRTDLELTRHGEDMARGLEPRLAGLTFAHVITSPSQRARRTCELAGLGASADVDVDLMECDYGDYEGLRTTEIRKLRPAWSLFRDGCPGGETIAGVARRADRVIARLRSLNGKIALFTHGQFGSIFAARWIGLSAVEGEHFALDPASISILGAKAGHAEIPVIALWNTVSGNV